MLAEWALTCWAMLSAGFTMMTLFRLRRGVVPLLSAETAFGTREIVLVRPLDAPAQHELRALQTPLDVPGPFVHAVASPQRPPDLPSSVRWLRSDPQSGNRKVGHLLNVLSQLPASNERIVLCIDADVAVDVRLVEELAAPIRAGTSSLSFAAPRPEHASSLAGKAVRGLLVQSQHSFRALDAMRAGAKAICGKAIGLSPAALSVFERLHDVAGEDLELSKLLYEQRLEVKMVQHDAAVLQSRSLHLAEVIDRFTRWMQVLRAHRPALFPSVPLFFACTPMLLALSVMAASSWALAATVGLVLVRCALAWRLERNAAGLHWFLGECVLLACWFLSLAKGRTLVWRGRRYRLARNGHLERLA